MSVCTHCSNEKKSAAGCKPHVYLAGKDRHPAIRYGDEREGYGRVGSKPAPQCHDCRARIGEFHHPKCEIEVCPVCTKQLTTCGCVLKIDWERSE